MKRLSNVLIAFLLFTSVVSNADLSLPPKQNEKQFLVQGELLKDPSFEMGGGVSTVTTASSYTTGTQCRNVGGASRCLLWNPVGSDTLTIKSKKDIPSTVSGYLSAQCFLRLIDKTHSYKLNIYDETNALTLASVDLPSDESNTYLPVKAEGIIVNGLADRNFSVQITSTANEAIIYVDDCTMELKQKAEVVSLPDVFSAKVSSSGVVTDENYDFINGSCTAGTGTLNCTFVSGLFYAAPNCLVSSASNGSYATTTNAPTTTGVTTRTVLASTAALSSQDVIISCQRSVSLGLPSTNEQIDWRVDANITGPNALLTTGVRTSYTGIEASSLTLVNNTSKGSLVNAMIPCSSTNDSTGTTCSSGSESNGIAFTPPTGGWVKVCVAGSIFQPIYSYDDDVTLQVVKTPNNAQTILSEGGDRLTVGGSTISDKHVWNTPFRNCGIFFLDSVSKHTFRLMYEKGSSSGGLYGSAPQVITDANASYGQRDIHWTVEPLVKYGNVLMANNVTTPQAPGVIKKGYALVSAKVSASGVVSNESGDWISGNCTNASPKVCTFTSGFWKSAPNCWGSVVPQAYNAGMLDDATTSSVGIYVYDDAGRNVTTSIPQRLFCHGEIN